MKVVQINAVYRKGSTGRTTFEMHQYLMAKGIESYVFTSMSLRGENNVFSIGGRLDHKIHALCSRLFGLQGYFSQIPTFKFVKQLKIIKPDVVILRNLHANYINLPILFRYLANEQIHVMIVLHDCWLFTGKCTHFTPYGCDKWKSVCNKCPALRADNNSLLFDFSSKMFNDRMRWYNSLKSLSVVAVSDWEKNLAEKSPLFTKSNITRIYNWIDGDIFKPYGKDAIIADKYYINLHKFTILGVCGRFSLAKGAESWKYLSSHLPEDCQIVLVGNMESGNEIPNVIHISYVDSPLVLAKIYSMADVFCNLSKAETFGKTTAEALACGTPIIVYNTTACPELAGKDRGYVCELDHPEEVLSKVLEVKRNGREAYSKNCVEFAINNLSKDNIIQIINMFSVGESHSKVE